MEIKDSPLYKALCEDVRKQDHAELLRMLEMVPLVGFRSEVDRLHRAFSWHYTPQGYDYWAAINSSIAKRNGRAKFA